MADRLCPILEFARLSVYDSTEYVVLQDFSP
jgi:hypothetical protein